ncbi:MAG: c-type cytochrome [Verrucomicrobia bacterium]|nr:c-type cytochrome [Verrucomicrobiota bacterium]
MTFVKDIKPIFEKSCVKCHGPEKQKGELRLDSREATLKGGDIGKVIEAGKIDKSPLLWSVARLDPDTAMPPEGKDEPLTKEQVSLIRAWIEQGAK